MNKIRQINQINQKELASKSTTYKSSWHYDYRDTNYVYIGNIPYSITRNDLLVMFSQYGIPTHINLPLDTRTDNYNDGNDGKDEKNIAPKHRGFAFLKYANFKSCILAIDNFNGVKVGGANVDEDRDRNRYGDRDRDRDARYLIVDHTYYKLRYGEREDDYLIDYDKVKKEMGFVPEESNPDFCRLKGMIEGKNPKLIKGNDFKVRQVEDDNKDDTMQRDLGDDMFGDDDDKYVNDDDEFTDPMKSFISEKKDNNKMQAHDNNDDDDKEFADPMEQFIRETRKHGSAGDRKRRRRSRSKEDAEKERERREKKHGSSRHKEDCARSPSGERGRSKNPRKDGRNRAEEDEEEEEEKEEEEKEKEQKLPRSRGSRTPSREPINRDNKRARVEFRKESKEESRTPSRERTDVRV